MRPTRHRYALILLLALISQIVACGGGGSSGGSGGSAVNPTDPAGVSFQQHLSYDDKVSVPFPQFWERQSPFEPAVLVAFLEQAESSSDQFRENVIIVRVPAGTPATGSGFSNIRTISSRQMEISGLTATETVFDADVAGAGQVALRFLEVSVELSGSIYALIYTGERAGFDRNIEIARYMAARMNLGQVIFDNMNSGSDLSTPGKPAIANNGTDFFVVSCREDTVFPYPAHLIGQFVTQDREITGSEILIHANVDTGNTGCTFTRPTVAFDGANYLVTYMTLINGNRRIAGKQVTTTGQVLNTTPIDISQNDRVHAYEPVTLFDGSRFLVVWQEDFEDPVTRVKTQQIRGAFVTSSGIGSSPFIIADSLPLTTSFVYRPQIALGNNQVMVIWEPRFESDTRQAARPLYSQFVDLSGSVLLPNPLLIRDDIGDNPRFAQVASDGQNYLVGWIEGLLEQGTIGAGQFGLYARSVSQAGDLLSGDASTTGLEIMPQSSEQPKEYLDLSYKDGEFLFLWADATFSVDSGVFANRVSADLSVISSAAPVSASESATYLGSMPRPAHPNVSYSPTQTLIAWPSEDGVVEGWYVVP